MRVLKYQNCWLNEVCILRELNSDPDHPTETSIFSKYLILTRRDFWLPVFSKLNKFWLNQLSYKYLTSVKEKILGDASRFVYHFIIRLHGRLVHHGQYLMWSLDDSGSAKCFLNKRKLWQGGMQYSLGAANSPGVAGHRSVAFESGRIFVLLLETWHFFEVQSFKSEMRRHLLYG